MAKKIKNAAVGTPANYKVEVSHPTGFHSGTHDLTVKVNFGGATRYVAGFAFGCSRDYTTDSDEQAIRSFLREHLTTAVAIKAAK